jgi:hypothetical protein
VPLQRFEHLGQLQHGAFSHYIRVSRKTLAALLLACAVIALILAAATLLPSSAPVISDLGYSTWCPFAPWSTLTLLFLGGLAWVVRSYIQKQPV